MFRGDLTDQAGAGKVSAMVAKTIYPSNIPLLAIGLMAWIESRAIGPTLFFEGSEVPGKQSAYAPISGDNIVAVLAILEAENLIRYRENPTAGASFTVAIMSEVQKMDLDLIRRCIEPEKGNGESVSEPTKSGFFVRSKPKTSEPIPLKSEPAEVINAQIMPENSPIRGGGLGGVSESGEASEAASEKKQAPEDPEIRKPPKRERARKSYRLTDEGKAYADVLKSEKEKSSKTSEQVEQICDWIGEFRSGVLKSAGVKKIHPAKWTPKSRRAIDVLLKAGYDIDDFKTAWTAQSNSDLKDRDPKKWKLFFTHSTIHREKNFARLIDSSGDIEGDASKAGESSWDRSSEPDPTDSMDQVPF